MKREKNTMKYAFIAMVYGYWGRGATIGEAAQGCKKQGAKRTDKAIVRLILGDDKPDVNSLGENLHERGSQIIEILNHSTLGALLKEETMKKEG